MKHAFVDDEPLATLTALQRDFPRWAMWRDGTGRWSATRAPGDREPSPGAWLLWVHADTDTGLAEKMSEADA